MPGPADRGPAGRVFLVLLALALIATGIALGRWQLRRAADKEGLQADIERRVAMPVIDLGDLLAADAAKTMLHRRVKLRGLWLASQSVYLENRQMNGVPGFYVLTPLALQGIDQTVMVQRGWVQRNFEDRTRLPTLATPPGLIDVVGRVAPPPGRLLDLGHAEAPAAAKSGTAGEKGTLPSTPGFSTIRQNLDLQAFKTETALPLRTDLTVMETGDARDGLSRQWPAPGFGAERNYGYAFQWFGLAALVAVLALWFGVVAPWRRAAKRQFGGRSRRGLINHRE